MTLRRLGVPVHAVVEALLASALTGAVIYVLAGAVCASVASVAGAVTFLLIQLFRRIQADRNVR